MTDRDSVFARLCFHSSLQIPLVGKETGPTVQNSLLQISYPVNKRETSAFATTAVTLSLSTMSQSLSPIVTLQVMHSYGELSMCVCVQEVPSDSLYDFLLAPEVSSSFSCCFLICRDSVN